jgi:hypothetical protein
MVTSYAPENDRGKYIGALWAANALGSSVGASIVLAVTASRGAAARHVPSSVYVAIICVQVVGILAAALLLDPTAIRRNDDRRIVMFHRLNTCQEIRGLLRALMTPAMLLTALALYSCQMPLNFF